MADNYVDPVTYFQNLPVLSAASGLLITDPADRVLLVKPTYRDHWTIPGGVVEHNEPPARAAAREALEELGLEVAVDRLLVAAWLAAHGRIPRPMIRFVFDGGTLDDTTALTLDTSELEEAAFIPLHQAAQRVHPAAGYTLLAAARARTDGAPVFLSHMIAPEVASFTDPPSVHRRD